MKLAETQLQLPPGCGSCDPPASARSGRKSGRATSFAFAFSFAKSKSPPSCEGSGALAVSPCAGFAGGKEPQGSWRACTQGRLAR